MDLNNNTHKGEQTQHYLDIMSLYLEVPETSTVTLLEP